jgi:transcriptional regulator with XRE-family HTH domain
MANINTKWTQLSDSAIVKQVGDFIKHTRLQRNQTQAQLATAAGLNRYTIGQIENGESVTLTTLIQLLRALDVLYVLEHFTVKNEIEPVAYAKMMAKKRKRASGNDSITEEPKDLGW